MIKLLQRVRDWTASPDTNAVGSTMSSTRPGIGLGPRRLSPPACLRRGRSGSCQGRNQGKVPDLYVSLKPGLAPSEDIRKRVEDSVIREIGAIARPRRVVIVPDMPKTRSGKIMRRVLGAISNNEDAGDISTLANPEIVDEIRKMKS